MGFYLLPFSFTIPQWDYIINVYLKMLVAISCKLHLHTTLS